MRHDSPSHDHDGRPSGSSDCDSSGGDSGAVAHGAQHAAHVNPRNPAQARSKGRRSLNGDKRISYIVTENGWRA